MKALLLALVFVIGSTSFANTKQVVKEIKSMHADELHTLFLDGYIPENLNDWNGALKGNLIERDQTNYVMYGLMQSADIFFWRGKTFSFNLNNEDPNHIGAGTNRVTDALGIFEIPMLGFDLYIEKSIIDGKDSIVLRGKTFVNNWFNDEVRAISYQGQEILLGYVDLVIKDNKAVSVWWILYK